MAVGKSGRKDGLRRSPVGLNFVSIDDNVSISSISDVAGQCFTGSSGNAPTLDTFNSFSPLSDSETECRMTHEGVPLCLNVILLGIQLPFLHLLLVLNFLRKAHLNNPTKTSKHQNLLEMFDLLHLLLVLYRFQMVVIFLNIFLHLLLL